MSDFTGADLGQLDELATAFDTAGAEISAKAEVLRAKIQSAIATFESSLTTMQSDTRTLTGQMNEEMGAVRSQADSVQWTGNNRAGFDADINSFATVVTTGTSQINDDLAGIKAQVDSGFTPVMTDFSEALRMGADEVNSSTATMRQAVDTQRSNLDQAANVGWTSA